MAAKSNEMSDFEQRANIKFCQKLGKTPRQTIEMLQQVHGDKAMDPIEVFKWHKFYKAEDDLYKLENEELESRPESRNEEINEEEPLVTTERAEEAFASPSPFVSSCIPHSDEQDMDVPVEVKVEKPDEESSTYSPTFENAWLPLPGQLEMLDTSITIKEEPVCFSDDAEQQELVEVKPDLPLLADCNDSGGEERDGSSEMESCQQPLNGVL